MNKIKNNPNNIDENEWELLREEYNSIRQETLERMERQNRIIGLNVGGIGTLLAIAFQFKAYPLFLVLPLLIMASMVLFDAERDSIINIGKYVKDLEKHIIANNKVKGWETWLWFDPKNQDTNKEHPTNSGKSVLNYKRYIRSGSFPRRKAYKHFDYASLTILFILLFACIIGIFYYPSDNHILAEILGVIYLIAGLYLFVIYLTDSK